MSLARAPLGLPLREPASLCFGGGNIILYGTNVARHI